MLPRLNLLPLRSMEVGAYGSMGVKISLHPHMDTPIHPYFLPKGGELHRALDLLGWWKFNQAPDAEFIQTPATKCCHASICSPPWLRRGWGWFDNQPPSLPGLKKYGSRGVWEYGSKNIFTPTHGYPHTPILSS